MTYSASNLNQDVSGSILGVPRCDSMCSTTYSHVRVSVQNQGCSEAVQSNMGECCQKYSGFTMCLIFSLVFSLCEFRHLLFSKFHGLPFSYAMSALVQAYNSGSWYYGIPLTAFIMEKLHGLLNARWKRPSQNCDSKVLILLTLL